MAPLATRVVYYDGCSICLLIAERFASAPRSAIEIVSLGTDRYRAHEAVAPVVTRLPSLVIGGQVKRLGDHSPIEHTLQAQQPIPAEPISNP